MPSDGAEYDREAEHAAHTVSEAISGKAATGTEVRGVIEVDENAAMAVSTQIPDAPTKVALHIKTGVSTKSIVVDADELSEVLPEDV